MPLALLHLRLQQNCMWNPTKKPEMVQAPWALYRPHNPPMNRGLDQVPLALISPKRVTLRMRQIPGVYEGH